MKKVNELVICKEDYDSVEEFENAVKEAVFVLLNNNYIMTVKYDANDKALGIVAIHYCYAEKEYGDYYPTWLLPEEEESIVYREDMKNEI